MELYDADGNLIEDAAERYVTKEQSDKMLADKLAEKDKEMVDIKGKLSKLENKDFNFKHLREMNDEEKAKLTAKEMELIQRQEKIEEDSKVSHEKQEAFLKGTIEEYRDDAISTLIGDDEESKKKVLFHYERIKDEAITKAQIKQKVRDAVKLAQDDNASSPLFRGSPSLGGDAPRRKGRDYSDSEEGKTLAKSLGMSWAQDKKK